MASKLSWKLNVDKRFKKAWKVFYFLKRTISSLAAKNTKLNAYVGYVIPVINYASPVGLRTKLKVKK